ncbi:hypothetical protein GLOIN_2v1765921 [Rhizophagus irregularis DAOM 181602=DAOM 197198]|nr:hypothetical protein GLOIN_2v1765921 [Rhizophagus irregularis DAOM 181602=DAOM 197198]
MIYFLQEDSTISNIKIVIFNLLINENARFTHLYIPREFDYQIHLIPGAKYCFSQLEFLHCNTSINTNVLIGLAGMCDTMRKLELCIEKFDNNREIVRLIETPKKLYNVYFLTNIEIDEPFCEIIENSLIKHSNNIQWFKITKQPTTNILSSLKNLRILELDDKFRQMKWDCLINLSLPYLQILKSRSVPNNVLASLIENTKGFLTDIVIDFTDFLDDDIIIVCFVRDQTTWDKIFELLINYAPKNLFKFKFVSDFECKLESLKNFFDNWKHRKSMSLQIHEMHFTDDYFNLIEKYIKNGIVKNFRYDLSNIFFDEFDWN